MNRAILLLILPLVSVNAQHVAEEPTLDQRAALALIAPEQDIAQLRNSYLAAASTSTDIKRAIEERVVIPGMCPLEAFAAAGLPQDFAVHERDQKRPFTLSVIPAQCEHPNDKVTIELLFCTETQFRTSTPVTFRVRFESGRAVLIDRDVRFSLPLSPPKA